MSKSTRKKKEETKRRFEAIKDLMSTFSMATIAVVATVVLIPASPKAEITKAIALNEEIVYQVQITDEDNGLDLSSLYVVLENQLEHYEQPISLGESSGYFDNLNYDTEYRLSIYGSKGFGQERLDTLLITTIEKVGGTILSVTPDTPDFSTIYTVDVSIYDPDLKYTSIVLYYGYSWEPDVEFQYSSMDILSPQQSIELLNIQTSYPFHIYLEGTTVDGTELLDEIWVTPPFDFYTSLQMQYIGKDEISFFLYNDSSVQTSSYKMNIYQNGFLIRTDAISIEEGDFHGSEFVIDRLSPNSTYTLECIVTYKHPQTLRQEQKIIYEEEITTLEPYSYSYEMESFDDYVEITITVIDPHHYFQKAFYELHDTSGEFDMYLSGETLDFINNGETKSTTFTIFVPIDTTYEILIGIRNENDFSITQIIDIIISE